VCDVCNGKRFTDETLEIRYNGLSISDILELTVDEAYHFFKGQRKITAITEILSELGLGYLKLGQPSTTLSGGEAQRVKLAYELSRGSGEQVLYILDEPTTASYADVDILLMLCVKLISKGTTCFALSTIRHLSFSRTGWLTWGPGVPDEVETDGRRLCRSPVDHRVDSAQRTPGDTFPGIPGITEPK
jgi:excinuclease UvrABC ATPase subunit